MKQHKIPTIALLMLMSATCLQVHAQGEFDLDELEEGQFILNLSAAEQLEVEQDTLNASLQFIAQGRDRIEIQQEVNSAMQAALDILEDSEGVEYSISNYNVYLTQAGRPSRADVENPVWRAQQSVQLNSTDSASLLDLAGNLQETGFTMGGLYYSLSPARYEEYADSLMTAALVKLQNKAEKAASALGRSQAEMIEVNLNGSQNYYARGPVPMAASREMAESFSAPVAEPGKTQVSVNVSARALISP